MTGRSLISTGRKRIEVARIADPLAKANLLRAARAEFASQGLSSARVEDIAKRAGLSKGSFYLHFENKEDAFLDIMDAFFADTARMTEGCRSSLADVKTAGEALAFFRTQDLQILEHLWANRDVLRIIVDGTSPAYSHVLDGFLDARSAIATEDIRRFQMRGIYRDDVDPDAVARIITGGYYNLSRRLTQLKTKPDLAALVDTVLKLFFEGLLPRPRKSRR